MLGRFSRRLILALIGAVAVTAICASGLISGFYNSVNDAIYQRPTTPDERIVIIGIDEKAIERFGSWPWDREVLASAIEYLNSDPEARPAIIGLDTVFDTESNPESDARLAKAAGEAGNVVVGSFAFFGSELVTNQDGSFYIDDYIITDFAEPYEELNESAKHGHVNAMLDGDGVLRHAIWEIILPDGSVIPAFYRVIAEEYSKISGLALPQAPPTDSRGRWYVVQQSLPNSYSDGVSVADLVDGTVSPQFFKDKIVLIGPYSPGLRDEYQTPISPAETMYGVEYQANAIGALLNGYSKSEPIQLQYVIVFILSFFCFAFLHRQKFIASTVFWLVGNGVWLAICLLMFQLDVIINVLFGVIALGAAYLVSIITNYFRELSERQRISFTFQRYVAPEIVTELLKTNNPRKLALGGRTVNIAVMFADIRGFTTLSSILPASKVVELLNKILTVSSESILHNRGTLDKYIGDCTMAFWGAPIVQEDYQYKAVKTALEIAAKISILSDELEAEYGYSLGCGIGVNCGSAVVGNIGSSSRMDYTVIGDTVNTASRLENIAKSGEVYVSREMAESLDGRIEFEYLGNDFAMKGLDKDFEVYRAVRIIDDDMKREQ